MLTSTFWNLFFLILFLQFLFFTATEVDYLQEKKLILLEVFLFFSVMMFFAEQIPAFCSTVRSACEDCCCQCFEVEENSGSIYYIPTGGHNKMSDYQERLEL